MNKNEILTALASVAQDAGRIPGQVSKFAELIVETIEPNRLTFDVFNAFMPVRQLNQGDSLVRRVRNYGLPIRTFVP